MTDENYEARAQAHLASIKRDMKASMEDAAVRAMHKVMAEFEAKSDERLMEDWGPGPHECHRLLCERFNYTHDERNWKRDQLSLIEWIAKQPAPVQEPVAQQAAGYVAVCEVLEQVGIGVLSRAPSKLQIEEMCNAVRTLTTSPPAQRKPLTHEQRVDLLAKFEAHKHEWHAPAILIDMVEAAHGIKGDA